MKQFLKLLIALLFAVQAGAQQKGGTAYLFFDESSPETYLKTSLEIGIDNAVLKKYRKAQAIWEKEHGCIYFYIGDELFRFNPNKQKVDTCSSEQLKDVKYLSDKQLSDLSVKYTLGKGNVFKKLYLVEKYSPDTLIRYEVYWQFYEE